MKVNSFIESFSVIKMDDINHNLSQITEIENRGHKEEIFRSKEEKVLPQVHSEHDSSSLKKCKFIITLLR